VVAENRFFDPPEGDTAKELSERGDEVKGRMDGWKK